MKKLSRLLIPAFAALVLTGCGKNDWFTLAPAAGGDTQQSTSAQGGGQAASSSQQGGGQATSSSQQGGGGGGTPTTTKSVKQIMEDVCQGLFGSAVENQDYYDSATGSYSYYSGYEAYEQYSGETESQLSSHISSIQSKMPSYLVASSALAVVDETDSETSEEYKALEGLYSYSGTDIKVAIFGYYMSYEADPEEGTEAFDGNIVFFNVYSEAEEKAAEEAWDQE